MAPRSTLAWNETFGDDYANPSTPIVRAHIDLCPSFFTQILNGDRITFEKKKREKVAQ